MNKGILIGILVLFVALVVAKTDYSNYEYYMVDRVNGKNLVLENFYDEEGLIERLVNNEYEEYDKIRYNSNNFKGSFGYGIPVSLDEEDTYISKDVSLSGSVKFSDKSKVDYKIIDFIFDDGGSIDEQGTYIYGHGTLVYEATIKIVKEIPVEVVYEFYQDDEDKESFDNEIHIGSIDGYTQIDLEDDGEHQTFSHNRKCYVGCDE